MMVLKKSDLTNVTGGIQWLMGERKCFTLTNPEPKPVPTNTVLSVYGVNN